MSDSAKTAALASFGAMFVLGIVLLARTFHERPVHPEIAQVACAGAGRQAVDDCARDLQDALNK